MELLSVIASAGGCTYFLHHGETDLSIVFGQTQNNVTDEIVSSLLLGWELVEDVNDSLDKGGD